MGPQYTPLRVFEPNKRCHRKDHSAKRRHRSCPFRKAPSPTLSVTSFLSTPGSQACHRGLSITPRCHAAGSRASACLFPLWVWTQERLHPTLGEKALKFI